MRCYWLAAAVAGLSLWASCCVDEARGQPTRQDVNGLALNYYAKNTNCTRAETNIRNLVRAAWELDPSITAALLRLVYSDCFVTGCDGSILLDGERSEKMADQNQGLRGFELIDNIKQEMESKCPGIVSCSDILHLAARDAVFMAGGWNYPVFTGRRDGTTSNVSDVDLPPPTISWDDAVAYFSSRNLDVLDLGTLLGAHTMGVAHCHYVHYRIYNYNNTGLPDATMDCRFARQLAATCPYKLRRNRPEPTVFLNPTTGASYNFSNSYYANVLSNEGVLGIDQQLTTSRDGVRIAEEYDRSFKDFRRFFANSMNRMGRIGVLTGKLGEIRPNCRFTRANFPH
ncbi:probable peroxidase 61 [Zingiber officinale]|uniref:probable peroxidase 61 n=1 Tax=Zingiber officinale TaxID=94328 RepID=UPI001C4AB77C|nr:probable peroxidase 61 [Zingiber officinale]